MSRVAVLGAGIVGRAAAWDLVRRGHDVVVADAREQAAAEVATEFGASHTRVDADDWDAVAALLSGCDAVVSAVPYALGVTVASAAIASGTHYCDFGGNPTIVGLQLELDDAARERKVAVVPDCGLAPGLANVLAMADLEAVGGIADRLTMRVGALPAVPIGPLGYQLAFSPSGLINEYDEPCDVIEDGLRTTVEPLTGFERVDDFPDFGELEAFHTAGGASTLTDDLDGRVRHLDYKTLRFPGHGHIFAAMRQLGLFSERSDTRTGVSPRSVLVRALIERLPAGEPDVVLLRTEATRGDRRHHHTIVDRHDGTFSALARTTAFPATAVIDRLVNGSVAPGARSMAAAVPGGELLADLRSVGIVADS